MSDKIPDDSKYRLVRNEHGYYSTSPIPDKIFLSRYYEKQFFSKNEKISSYKHKYTEEELEHKILQYAEAEMFSPGPGKRLLEIGVGEGFGLHHFNGLGWTLDGVDYNTGIIDSFFPDLSRYVWQGDACEYLEIQSRQGKVYDLVICNNVLEHVTNPEKMARLIARALSPDGICRIAVPNDDSWVHEDLAARGVAEERFFVHFPGHLHYFNAKTLRSLLVRNGLEAFDMLADFPTNIFLYNEDTNYLRDTEKGRRCHFAKVAFEMSLWKQSLDALIHFRRGCLQAGVGRNLIAYARKKVLNSK